MIDIDPGQAILVDWTEHQYFADTEYTSRSDLGEMSSRPAVYRARQLGTGPKRVPTKSMGLGTNVHFAVLEPDQWAARVVAPEPPRPEMANARAKKGTPARNAYETWKSEKASWTRVLAGESTSELETAMIAAMAAAGGPIVVTAKDLAKVNRIAAAVRRNAWAAALLDSPGPTEQTVLWCEPETGIKMKIRADKITVVSEETATRLGGGLLPGRGVLDLKSTADSSPAKFARSAVKFGYGDQAAIYHDAVQALEPGDPLNYYIAAVETAADGDHATAVYLVDDESLEAGRQNYKDRLRELALRRYENDWLAPWQRGVQSLSIKDWKRR